MSRASSPVPAPRERKALSGVLTQRQLIWRRFSRHRIGRLAAGVSESLRRDEGFRVGVLQDVAGLGRGQVVVDRRQVPACLAGGQIHFDHRSAVGQNRCDAVPLPHPDGA